MKIFIYKLMKKFEKIVLAYYNFFIFLLCNYGNSSKANIRYF